MLDQMTLFNLTKFTSSPASGSGATHSDEPNGRTIDPSLPDHAHASPSQEPAKKKEQKTADTSGRKCIDSSPVYQRAKDRQQSLANRLHKKLVRLGSTLYKQTWRKKTTPQGWSFFQLVASAHRTSGKDSTGSPTTWNSPNAMDGNRGPCAITMDENGNAQRISQTTGIKFGMSLVTQSQLTGPARLTATGELQIGSGAEIKSGGQLNPALPRWLMGLPREWCDSAVTATPSSRPKRKRS
jgi:hypothetical protein